MAFNSNKKGRFMRALPAVLLAALLQACGGGGGDDDTATSPAYLDEFIGDWKAGWQTTCDSIESGNGNVAYIKDKVDLTLTESKGTMSLYMYSDANCSADQITIRINFGLQTSQTTLAGYDNVIRALLKYESVSITQNGQAVDIPQEVKDELALTEDIKTIADVNNNRLYLGEDEPLDADGYPTAFDTSTYLVR